MRQARGLFNTRRQDPPVVAQGAVVPPGPPPGYDQHYLPPGELPQTGQSSAPSGMTKKEALAFLQRLGVVEVVWCSKCRQIVVPLDKKSCPSCRMAIDLTSCAYARFERTHVSR